MKLAFVISLLWTVLANTDDEEQGKFEGKRECTIQDRWLTKKFKQSLDSKDSTLRFLKKKQKYHLIERIVKSMRMDIAQPLPVLVFLQLNTNPGGEERKNLENEIKNIIDSWTDNKSSKHVQLTKEQKNELISLMFNVSVSVAPETLQRARKAVEEWAREPRSSLGYLMEDHINKFVNITGLQHQAVVNNIYCSTPVSYAARIFLGTEFIEELDKNPDLRKLMSNQKEKLRDKYVDNINEVILKPLTRMGVLSMLGNPTQEERIEFRENLGRKILVWTRRDETLIEYLNKERREQLVEVIVTLTERHAKRRKQQIAQAIGILNLTDPLTLELTNHLVSYSDGLRRKAAVFITGLCSMTHKVVSDK